MDVLLVTGDTYVDLPSFGRRGSGVCYRRPDIGSVSWPGSTSAHRSTSRSSAAPGLFVGIASGAMDSMVNHYTAYKRLRSDDAHTPAA